MSFVGTGVALLVVVALVVDSVVRSALVAVVELVAVIVGGDHHCRGGASGHQGLVAVISVSKRKK